MRWPWILRSSGDKLYAEYTKEFEAHKLTKAQLDVNTRALLGLRAELGGVHTAYAMEQNAHASTKESLGHLQILCRDQETALRDCKDPPITRKELDKLLKQHSFVARRAEVLSSHNEELQNEIKALTQKRGKRVK